MSVANTAVNIINTTVAVCYSAEVKGKVTVAGYGVTRGGWGTCTDWGEYLILRPQPIR